MEEMNKKNQETLHRKLTSTELLIGEIVYQAKLNGLDDDQLLYFDLLMKRYLAIRIVLDDNVQRIECWKISGAMQSDIQSIQNLITKISNDLLPAAEIAVENVRTNVYDFLKPAFDKIRKKYQEFLDQTFSEVENALVPLTDYRTKIKKLH